VATDLESLRSLIEPIAGGGKQRENVVRAHLQLAILEELDAVRFFDRAAFIGGTALRVVHGIRRFSEDIDFSGRSAGSSPDIRESIRHVCDAFAKQGFTVAGAIKDNAIVHAAKIEFRGLLHALELSGHPAEKLTIKVEIDTNPPAGATLERQVLRNEGRSFEVVQFDLPSMFAGKLHAILQRQYTKGRDFFDLDWYLDRRVQPNIVLLNNALAQSGWTGPPITPTNWRSVVANKVATVEFGDVLKTELSRFVEHESLIRRVDKDRLLERLGQRDLER